MAGKQARRRSEIAEVAADAVVSAAAATLGAVDIGLGIAAAGSAPAISAGAKIVLHHVSGRRDARKGRTLELAAALTAALTGRGTDELMERLVSTPEREQLLLRTMNAAGDTALQEKLVAYAVALTVGDSGSDDEVLWETTFVRALDDLDSVHLELLRRFGSTSNELGLGNGDPEFDNRPEALNQHQIERAASDLPNRPALLAVLQRHGLLASESSSPATLRGVGTITVYWRLTEFGSDFLARLRDVGAILVASRDTDG